MLSVAIGGTLTGMFTMGPAKIGVALVAVGDWIKADGVRPWGLAPVSTSSIYGVCKLFPIERCLVSWLNISSILTYACYATNSSMGSICWVNSSPSGFTWNSYTFDSPLYFYYLIESFPGLTLDCRKVVAISRCVLRCV